MGSHDWHTVNVGSLTGFCEWQAHVALGCWLNLQMLRGTGPMVFCSKHLRTGSWCCSLGIMAWEGLVFLVTLQDQTSAQDCVVFLFPFPARFPGVYNSQTIFIDQILVLINALNSVHSIIHLAIKTAQWGWHWPSLAWNKNRWCHSECLNWFSKFALFQGWGLNSGSWILEPTSLFPYIVTARGRHCTSIYPTYGQSLNGMTKGDPGQSDMSM